MESKISRKATHVFQCHKKNTKITVFSVLSVYSGIILLEMIESDGCHAGSAWCKCSNMNASEVGTELKFNSWKQVGRKCRKRNKTVTSNVTNPCKIGYVSLIFVCLQKWAHKKETANKRLRIYVKSVAPLKRENVLYFNGDTFCFL